MNHLFFQILILFFSIGTFAVELVGIQNTKCSKYLGVQYGLAANSLCVDGQSIFICHSENPPFGAKLPETFFNDLKIEKSRVVSSLTEICTAAPAVEPPKMSKNCRLSDHALFKPFIDRIGISLNSCFCELDGAFVLSTCILNADKWQATAEFDSHRVRDDLNKICTAKIIPDYKIACFCNKHYGGSVSDYFNCLSAQTSKKTETTNEKKSREAVESIR